MIEFEVRHTADSLRRIYGDWWSRRFGFAYWISFGLTVAVFVAMLVLKAAPWPLVVAATVFVVCAGYLRTIRDNAIRLVLERQGAHGDTPIRYALDADGIREWSAIGDVQLRWTAFDSLVRHSSAFLLFRKPKGTNSFVVFPMGQIPTEAVAFIEQRLRTT